MNETGIATPKELDISSLRHYLKTQSFGIGGRLVFSPIVDSTNIQAMKFALNGEDEGMVVLTDSQRVGKGRLGRRWIDRCGCDALTSTLLRPLFPPYQLVMIASLAVVKAIDETCGVTATIKWPNDILIQERKVAGILIETSHDRSGRMVAIVGIGININGHISESIRQHSETQQTVTELGVTATTLECACGHKVSREAFIACLLQQLETLYLAMQHEAQDDIVGSSYETCSRLLREQWRHHLCTLGRTIQVRQGNTVLSGKAEDVNDSGELLLRRHSGEQISISWGDVGYPTK